MHTAPRYKPKTLAKQKPLLRAILEALTAMMSEPLPEGYDDAQVCSRVIVRAAVLVRAHTGESAARALSPVNIPWPLSSACTQELPACKLGAQALDSLAVGLPSSAIFPPVWEFAG